jgi:ankyrin repeat protein
VDANGFNPFLAAVSNHASDAVLDYLVSVGADIHQIDVNGDDALIHAACFAESARSIKKLLDLGVKHQKHMSGKTALSMVMRMETIDSVCLLVEHAGVNLDDIEGNLSAMEVATQVGNEDIIAYIASKTSPKGN